MAAYGFSNALVPGRFNIWIPNRANSAYLSFDTAAEAQNDVRAHQMGVIVDPKGAVDPALQTWTGWTAWQNKVPGTTPVVLNPTTPTAAPAATASPGAAPAIPTTPSPPTPLGAPASGQYNVFVPAQWLATTGANNINGAFNGGVFLAFSAQADAQAYVRTKGLGVVIDPKGAVDSTQPWAQAASYAAMAQNFRLETTPTPGKFSVWFPAGVVNSTGMLNPQKFATTGAYLSFDTQADAAAFVQRRGFGGVVTPKGLLDATQPWPSIRQYMAQLSTQLAQIKPDAVAGKYNVWVPQQYAGQIGITNQPGFTHGAYLAFDSQAEAQTFAKGGNLGVILTPTGDLDATQVWGYAAQFGVQLSNGRLTAKPTAGEFNVWFPAQYVNNLGVTNTGQFPTGAYLSFKTEAEAQAHERARNMGVLFDAAGKPSATQPWPYAGQFLAQLENARLKPTPTAGEFNAWFPQQYVGSLGLPNTTGYTTGAYLSFKTEAEAQAHIRARGGWGVVLDTAGNPAATQVWNQANQFAMQLMNPKLQTTPTKGEFNVWFPQQYLSSLGQLPNAASFTTGAYLPFKTEAEAQAHVRARGNWGVILDQSGLAAATQIWNTANQFASQLLNPQLKTAPIKGEFNVWFPLAIVNSLGVPNAQTQFPKGAYLGFKSEADAQTHIRQRGGWGVVLDEKGKLSATQPWGAQANNYGAQLLNDELTPARKAGKFNVWFPQQYVPNLGAANVTPFTAGAYIAFDTLADAQAHARARNMGVVLDDKGAYDQTAQTWPYAAQMQLQLTNALATTQRTAGKYNVWFPQAYLQNVGMNAQSFNGGAFIAFASQADAQAHVKARGVGMIIDGNGAIDATQPWGQATQFTAQLTNAQLAPKRVNGQFSVWFPQPSLGTIGVQTPQNFPGGAYLSFATLAEAQAHVQARGNVGVLLDEKGTPSATQLWPQANQMLAQLRNVDLVAKQAPGKFAVWFPQSSLGTIGVVAPQNFPGGAFLSFDSLAEAQAHAVQRGNVGVLLDADGSYDATQVWAQANAYVAQKLNSQLTPSLNKGKWNVWFPSNIFANIGVSNGASFPTGAYLAFDSKQDAVNHAKNRGNLGVIVDDKGQASAVQLWPNALTMAAQNKDILPPPPSGWVSAPGPADPAAAAKLGNATAGSVSITSVTPTKTGADVVVHVATIRPPDSFKFFVGGQVNGNWMPIFSIPDLVNLATVGWNQFTLHIDYSAIDTFLKGINPALGVQPNMNSAIGIKFTSGHDTGIPGWSQNQGTERDAPFQLPAMSP